VPEPPSAEESLAAGQSVVGVSFRRLGATLKDIRQYSELFKFLISFLIYNDGIGTIIGVAAIYGAELGFGSLELILALLLVQFVGIPFSLIFGRLPTGKDRHRGFYLAFVLLNLVGLPLAGGLGANLLPAEITGVMTAAGRDSNLLMILGMVVGMELILLLVSYLLGPRLLSGMAEQIETKRSILIGLIFYAVIAVWGFFLNSVIEFWFLAWMVAVVQGGSQALSRSLYASMSPAAKSGEFFGLFSVMAKFSSFLGPLIFAAAGTAFGSSRPAVLSLIAFFLLGGVLLLRVDVDAGRAVARAEDRTILGASAAD
jgi:MFS-type transporter involved in bile tolerance (Atg22 family)